MSAGATLERNTGALLAIRGGTADKPGRAPRLTCLRSTRFDRNYFYRGNSTASG